LKASFNNGTRIRRALLVASVVTLSLAGQLRAQTDPKLEQIAAFPDHQVTGITVAGDGRIFLCFPYWSDPHTVSVARLDANSRLTPYPDENWNQEGGAPADHFICVQSVFADDQNNLWVLDPASIKMQKVTPNGAKLSRSTFRQMPLSTRLSFLNQWFPTRVT
jgi:hypothetical protein